MNVYTLRNLDPEWWQQVRDKAWKERRSVRDVIISLLDGWLTKHAQNASISKTDGLPAIHAPEASKAKVDNRKDG